MLRDIQAEFTSDHNLAGPTSPLNSHGQAGVLLLVPLLPPLPASFRVALAGPAGVAAGVIVVRAAAILVADLLKAWRPRAEHELPPGAETSRALKVKCKTNSPP